MIDMPTSLLFLPLPNGGAGSAVAAGAGGSAHKREPHGCASNGSTLGDRSGSMHVDELHGCTGNGGNDTQRHMLLATAATHGGSVCW
jgi:hypothetical protein